MKRSKFIVAIALTLVVVMFTNLPIRTFAISTPIYISDIKIGYSKDRSLSGMREARKSLQNAGYEIVDNDLNSGTGKGWSYIGYKTTKNKDEAITDLAVMDMKGGYESSNYNAILAKSKNNMNELAEDIKTAAEEFNSNYKKGSPAAKVAYEALNVIVVPEAGKQKLGDYILSDTRTTDDFFQIILKVHPDILSLIYSQLTLGTVDYNNNDVKAPEESGISSTGENAAVDTPSTTDTTSSTSETSGTTDTPSADDTPADSNNTETWVKRLEKIDSNKDDYDPNTYYDRAKSIYQRAKEFTKNIDDAFTAQDNNEKLTDTQMLSMAAYEILNEYEFGGEGIGDYLSNPYMNVTDLYPVVDALTKGQLGMMAISGIEVFAFNLINTEETYKDAYAKIDEQKKVIPAGYSLWEGVDVDAFSEEVAVTNAAQREMAANNDFSALTKTNTMSDTINQAIKIVGITASVLAAVATFAAIGVSVVSGISIGFTTFMSALTASWAGSVAGAVSSVVFSAAAIGVIVAIVVLIILAFVLLGMWIQEQIDYYNPTYTKIPGLMYDVIEDTSGNSKYIKYEAVKDQTGNAGDLNCWQGTEWNALYFTKDAEAGAPILADFFVQTGNGVAPQGYSPLHMFGEVSAVNTNKHTYKDSYNGIYVFFLREGGVKENLNGQYLSDLIVESASNKEDARSKVLAKGFTVLEFNLINEKNSECFAFIGYKTTTNPDRAITDIRVGYKYNTSTAYLGEASYGNSGTFYDTTIYTSKRKEAGVPILADFFASSNEKEKAPAGYEPVSLLAGGPAFNFCTAKRLNQVTPSMLYFKPSQTFTEGPDYVSGIAFFSGNASASIKSQFGGYERFGKQYLETTAYEKLDKVIETGGSFSRKYTYIAYSTTKNPYRALRKISIINNSSDNNTTLSGGLNFGGLGYAAVPAYYNIMPDVSFGFNTGPADEVGIYDKHTYMNSYLGADQSNALYVTSATSKGAPFTIKDIVFSEGKELSSLPQNYVPVSAFMDYSGKAFNLRQGSSSSSLYMYLPGKVEKEKYVSGLLFAKSEYSNDLAKMDLFAQGCEDVVTEFNLDMTWLYDVNSQLRNDPKQKDKNGKEINPKMFGNIGVTRTNDVNEAITDIKLVLFPTKMPEAKSPPYKTTINGIEYTLASNTEYSLQAFPMWIGDSMKNEYVYGDDLTYIRSRGYLYTTKNINAGSPIVGLSSSSSPKKGLNNSSSAQSKANCDNVGMIAYKDSYFLTNNSLNDGAYFTHSNLFISREETHTKYICEIDAVNQESGSAGDLSEIKMGLARLGLNNFINFDLNKGSGSEYCVYLGYSKTNIKSQAITGLITIQDSKTNNPPKTIDKNGITYTIITNRQDFNKGAGGDFIYLYYTKDPKAGEPLTDLVVNELLLTASPGTNTSNGLMTVSFYERVIGRNGESGNFNSGIDGGCGDPPPAVFMHFKRAAASGNGSYPGSIFGEPSYVVLVLSFLMLAVPATVVIYKKKRQERRSKQSEK